MRYDRGRRSVLTPNLSLREQRSSAPRLRRPGTIRERPKPDADRLSSPTGAGVHGRPGYRRLAAVRLPRHEPYFLGHRRRHLQCHPTMLALDSLPRRAQIAGELRRPGAIRPPGPSDDALRQPGGYDGAAGSACRPGTQRGHGVLTSGRASENLARRCGNPGDGPWAWSRGGLLRRPCPVGISAMDRRTARVARSGCREAGPHRPRRLRLPRRGAILAPDGARHGRVHSLALCRGGTGDYGRPDRRLQRARLGPALRPDGRVMLGDRTGRLGTHRSLVAAARRGQHVGRHNLDCLRGRYRPAEAPGGVRHRDRRKGRGAIRAAGRLRRRAAGAGLGGRQGGARPYSGGGLRRILQPPAWPQPRARGPQQRRQPRRLGDTRHAPRYSGRRGYGRAGNLPA